MIASHSSWVMDAARCHAARRNPDGAAAGPGSLDSLGGVPAQDVNALGRSGAVADGADQVKFTSLHHM
jgi:hypothetical protein